MLFRVPPGVLTGLLLMISLSGCQPQIPPVRKEAPLAYSDAWAAGGEPLPVQPWLEDFDDANLEGMVEEAVGYNFSLRAAQARVDQAQARARIVGADRYPSVDLTATGARGKISPGSNQGFGGITTDSFRLQGELSWEADLWGRIADRTRAAKADAEASEWQYDAARLSLGANVTRAWLDCIEATQQLRLAEQTVDSFQRSLLVVEEQFRRGIGAALDVRLARNTFAAAQSNLQVRTRELRALLRALEVLLGRYPDGSVIVPEDFPVLTTLVPVGLPSELLTRRPDLIAAERRLLAAEFRSADTERNRFPSIVLTTSGGTASDELRDLVDLDFSLWSLAANLSQPLFQAGRLEAERDQAAAQVVEAYNDYAQTLVTAFNEVETALDATVYLEEQQKALEVAAREAYAAETIALEQYQRGLTGIITLLESQRRAFTAKSALLTSSNQRLKNRVNLHLALGGDFDSASQQSSEAAP
jgi:multidrug efflux system outer membrane protein